MIELHVTDTEVQSSVVPIRWCLSRAAVDKLRECKQQLPYLQHYLLIIVSSSLGEDAHTEQRYVCPLEELLAYIPLIRPGLNRIFAVPIEMTKKSTQELLMRNGNGYTYTLLTDSGAEYWSYRARDSRPLSLCNEEGSTTQDDIAILDLEAPAGVFAKPRPAWEQDWVNWLHEGKPVDQCQYRRRFLLAFGLKWLLFLVLAVVFVPGYLLIWAVRVVVLAFLFSVGVVGNYDWKALCKVADSNSELIPTKRGGPHHYCTHLPHPWNVLLLPWVPLIVAGCLVPGLLHGGAYWSTLLVLPFASAFAYAMARKKQRPKKASKATDVDLAFYDDLVCNGDLRPSVSALPPRRRTIRLYYHDVKALVCKPFAR